MSWITSSCFYDRWEGRTIFGFNVCSCLQSGVLVMQSDLARRQTACNSLIGERNLLSTRGESVKIVEDGRAPNPRRVRIFLAEKGIEVPLEQIDIMGLEHKDGAHTAQNPFQRVPYLVLDDGTVIAESVAISRYFEEVQPEPALFGQTPVEKATVEMWNRRAELNFLFPVAQSLRHLNPKMAELETPQVSEWGEANKSKALAALGLLNDALGHTQYLAGNKFSIADITVLVGVDFMRAARIERPHGLTNVSRWYEEVSERPSARA